MRTSIINFIQLILHSIPDQWSPTRSLSLFTPFPTNGRLPVAFHFLLFILHSSLFTLQVLMVARDTISMLAGHWH